MTLTGAIVVTGSEILAGQIEDANGPWLVRKLRDHGIKLTSISIVGDDPEDIKRHITTSVEKGIDLLITTGGLGPTDDDLTVQVVADYFNKDLDYDEQLFLDLVEKLRGRRFKVSPGSRNALEKGLRKQAIFPKGAEIIPPVGTAPGIILSDVEPLTLILPGPPSELQPIWEQFTQTDSFLDLTASKKERTHLKVLRFFRVSEPQITESLNQIQKITPGYDEIGVTTCLRTGELELTLDYTESEKQIVNSIVQQLQARHGNKLFSENGESIESLLMNLLRKKTISVAESCTGGLISDRLTSLSGSSAYFEGGLVTYSNRAKINFAGVSEELLDEHGAVSAPVALAMARGARDRFDTDLAASVTGIAGPTGATPTKPVGRVYFCVVDRSGQQLERQFDVPGDRAQVRSYTATICLHLIREFLTADIDE